MILVYFLCNQLQILKYKYKYEDSLNNYADSGIRRDRHREQDLQICCSQKDV